MASRLGWSHAVAFSHLRTASLDDRWHELIRAGTPWNGVVGWIVGFSGGHGPAADRVATGSVGPGVCGHAGYSLLLSGQPRIPLRLPLRKFASLSAPQGLAQPIAMPKAEPSPTEIGVPAVLVAVSIGTTVPVVSVAVTTYAVAPFGVMAMPKG